MDTKLVHHGPLQQDECECKLKYICEICKQAFKRQVELDRHEFGHTGTKKYRCSFEGCDKLYTVGCHLKRHILSVHQKEATPKVSDISCLIKNCCKRFSSKSTMLRHVREVHENPKTYPCRVCDASFSQKIKLKRHEVKMHQHSYPFCCSICHKGFFSQCQHDQHTLKCKTYSCKDCAENFDKWSVYLRHCREQKHSYPYSKDNSNENHDMKGESAVLAIEAKYVCNIDGCGRKFTRLDHLDRHEYYHTGKKKHLCEHENCDRSYSMASHLRRHIRTAHMGSKSVKTDVACPIEGCQKQFSSNFSRDRHVREVHKNPKIYPCTQCDESFTQKLKLKRHVVLKHSGAYPFKCAKCSKGILNEWQLARHESSCKIYKCSACSECFQAWSEFVKHRKETRHGRQYHECTICNRIYGRPSELQKHIAMKHESNGSAIQTFVCPHESCNRVYKYERNLKHHTLAAHEGKAFLCEIKGCERTYVSAQCLTLHKEKCHSDQQLSKSKERSTRRRRKDAGLSVKSTLSKLCGINVDRDLDGKIRAREEDALNMIAAKLLEEVNDIVSSDESTIMPTRSVMKVAGDRDY